jgi:hypothetical protein
MSFTTVLKEGGLVPYLIKAKGEESFLNIPQIPYYDDIRKLGKQVNPNQNVVQELALFLLLVILSIFGLLMVIITINYLVGYTAAKAIMYISMNILPHILGLLLFSYYYIAFLVVLWYFGLLSGKTPEQSTKVLLPGTIVFEQHHHATKSS